MSEAFRRCRGAAAILGPRAEHLATRRAAGLFDFLVHGDVRGQRAAGSRRSRTSADAQPFALLAPGGIFYTLLLRDDGSVLNDATIWCHAPERYWLFTGRRGDYAWIDERLQARHPHSDVRLSRLSGQHAILALQGPRSFDILHRALDAPLGELRYFAFKEARARRRASLDRSPRLQRRARLRNHRARNGGR